MTEKKHDKVLHGDAGFTIVGLSMLMILLGILVSVFPYLLPGVQEVADKETAALLEANRNAVIGYAGVQGRLPVVELYPSLVPSHRDGYRHATHYTYDARLAEPGGICRARRGEDGLILTGLSERAAFVIWSNGHNGTMDPERPIGAVPSETELPVGEGDDVVKWASVTEVREVARCR